MSLRFTPFFFLILINKKLSSFGSVVYELTVSLQKKKIKKQ